MKQFFKTSWINPQGQITTSQPSHFPYFSNRRIRNNVLLIVFLLLVNKLGVIGNVASFGVLILMSLRSLPNALKALSIGSLIIVASDVFVSKGAAVGILKYIFLFVAGISLLRHVPKGYQFRNPFKAFLLLFGIVVAVLALIGSYYPEISLLKITMFTYGAFCLLSVTTVKRDIGPEMTEWAVSFIFTAVLLSYLALVVGAGYGSYDTIWGGRFSGYRGVFNHPQAMGIMSGLFSVYLTALLMFYVFPKQRLVIILLVGTLVLVYLSEARTGMYSYILATGLMILFSGRFNYQVREKRSLRRYRNKLAKLAMLGLVALLLVELVSGKISMKAEGFIHKGKETQQITAETFYSSRSNQIERSWRNFKDHPYIGIGFGTELSIFWQRRATLLSASTEKGFLPTAILEEVGIVGTMFFLLFLGSLYAYLLRSKNMIGFATLSGLLILNLGEMIFFSFGGLGMLTWTLVALSLTTRK